jgi:hypothetical protein
MLTFVQDGQPLPVAKPGYAPIRFEHQADGLSFSVEGTFLQQLPSELIGAGTPLGHASGPIKFRLIDDPAVQTGPNSFRIQFNRGNQGGVIWIQEEHPGDEEYRRAVQPGQNMIPSKLTEGKPQ